MMNYLKLLWALLAVLLCLSSCQKDLFFSGEPLPSRSRVPARQIETMRVQFERDYKGEALRAIEAPDHFDFDSLSPQWQYAVQDTLLSHLLVTAIPINLHNFSLPASQTYTKEDIHRFEGLVSFPRLYHYRDLLTGREWFDVVILQPTKDWLEANGNRSIGQYVTVPRKFEGLIDVYTPTKKPLYRYVYTGGIARATYRYEPTPKSEARSAEEFCSNEVVGYKYHSRGEEDPITGEVVVIGWRTSVYKWVCRSVGSNVSKRDNVADPSQGGGGGAGASSNSSDDDKQSPPYDNKEDKKREREAREKAQAEKDKKDREKMEEDCDKLKELQSAPSDYRDYFDKVKAHRDAKNSLGEIGFVELGNGMFMSMTPNGGHSVQFPTLPSGSLVRGMIHNHTNPTLVGGVLSPIQIFSPTDIVAFLKRVDEARVNKNSSAVSHKVAPDEVYSVLVAEDYVYRLKFASEEAAEQLASWSVSNDLEAEYKKFTHYEETAPLQGGLLEFMTEHIGLDGLMLQRIDKNGNVRTSMLQHYTKPRNGKIVTRVQEIDC